jgi:hypothetical protein
MYMGKFEIFMLANCQYSILRPLRRTLVRSVILCRHKSHPMFFYVSLDGDVSKESKGAMNPPNKISIFGETAFPLSKRGS